MTGKLKITHSISDYYTRIISELQNLLETANICQPNVASNNDYCILCKEPARERQQGIQCDGCLKWNHRTCNTGMEKKFIEASSCDINAIYSKLLLKYGNSLVLQVFLKGHITLLCRKVQISCGAVSLVVATQ